jgi:hypothetical protein
MNPNFIRRRTCSMFTPRGFVQTVSPSNITVTVCNCRTNEERTMRIYRIEQYELHVRGYIVSADSEADAIAKLFQGEADSIDDSLVFVEIADDHGMPVDEKRDLAGQLFDRNMMHSRDEVIPSIRNIEDIGDEHE